MLLPLAASVTLSLAAAGGPGPTPGFLLGDELRFRRAPPLEFTGRFIVRTLADVVAIPASVPRWTAADWALFAGIVAPTVTAMVPMGGRSPDARLQDAVHGGWGANCPVAPPGSTVCATARAAPFHLWVPASNVAIGVTEVAVPLGLLVAGALSGHDGLLESSSLALEAMLVSQLYHVVLKLLTGREGVLSRSGAGAFSGPTRLHFPDGFPSGHAMTLFSLIGAFGAYVDSPWLTAGLLAVGATLATWLVLDDYHFASEVVFGAATGFLIGRFVVRHRAQRHEAPPPVELRSVSPLLMPNASGLSVAFAF
ncbi:MAG: phosphatase PAP2 family protein [Myxococcaceae bacterium]|nr:phosphatase PAP2 family protein [Myxococcaceae bacterium]